MYGFTPQFINEIADEIVSRELAKINLPFNKIDLVIGVQHEPFVDVQTKLIDNIIAYGFNKIILLVDHNIRKTYSQLLSKNILERCEILPIIFFPVYSMNYLEKRNIQYSQWNWYNKKGYFPTGTLDRHNRVGFLKRLYDLNLLDDIIWTFPKADRQKSLILKYFIDNFGELPMDFEEFFNYCNEYAYSDDTRILDNDDIKDLLRPFDINNFPVRQYQLSNFTILSESDEDFFTEKTAMAVLHHHPFIVLGNNSRQLFDNLKELGFNTFNNYLPYPEYATIDDRELRWKQTIENIRVFPKILQDRREEISGDIQYNYDLCLDFISQTTDQLRKISPDLIELLLVDGTILNDKRFINKFGVDLFKKYKEREKVLLEEESIKRFIRSYNNIKGKEWPEIHSEVEFYSLPDSIKRECKERFNFPLSGPGDLSVDILPKS
jgi:hypothetical protein